MAKFKCDVCGGEIDAYVSGAEVTCRFCYAPQVAPEFTPEELRARPDDNASPTTETLLRRGYIYLEDTLWDKADEYMERVLDCDPECSRAYLGKLMASEGATSVKALRVGRTSLKIKRNFVKACRYASPRFLELLEDIENQRLCNGGAPGVTRNEAPEFLKDARKKSMPATEADIKKSIFGDNKRYWGVDDEEEAREESAVSETGPENEYDDAPAGPRSCFGMFHGEPIQWIVLEEGEEHSLVISKYGLAPLPFNEKGNRSNWSTCSLRRWLNSTFLKGSFNEGEQALIPATQVTAEKSNMPGSNAKEGQDTIDKIFLLSIGEFKDLFQSEEEAYCLPTKDAELAGAKIENGDNNINGIGNGEWWLRNQGLSDTYAATVNTFGEPYIYGQPMSYDRILVRPAMWVKNEVLKKEGFDRTWREQAATPSTTDAQLNEAVARELGTFGNYFEPLKWKVLRQKGRLALIVAEKAVECRPFHDMYDYVDWKSSSLRQWLNDDFIKGTFSKEEQKRIIESVDGEPLDKKKKSGQGEDSAEEDLPVDRVFLLSDEEAHNLFAEDEERQCEATKHARDNGAYINDGYLHPHMLGYCGWWLRVSGVDETYAAMVDEGGVVTERGLVVCEKGVGVRPAMWIKLSKE